MLLLLVLLLLLPNLQPLHPQQVRRLQSADRRRRRKGDSSRGASISCLENDPRIGRRGERGPNVVGVALGTAEEERGRQRCCCCDASAPAAAAAGSPGDHLVRPAAERVQHQRGGRRGLR